MKGYIKMKTLIIAVIGLVCFGQAAKAAAFYRDLKCYDLTAFQELTQMGGDSFKWDNDVLQRSSIKFSPWGETEKDEISLININHNGRNWLLLHIDRERRAGEDRVCVINDRRLSPKEMQPAK